MAAAKQQLKKYTQAETAKKTVCGDQPIKKEPLKKPSCTQMTFFPSYPTYPTYPTLSYPILSFPFPTRSSFPVPLPILSSAPFSVPFRLDLHSYPHPSGIFFDLISVLTPFCTPLIARRFEVNRFLQKNNFWKRVHLRQYFYDIFEESALQLPPPPPKNDNRDKRRAKTTDFLHFWNRMHCFFAFS